jgi:DNA replication and repair protein RecF
VRVDRVRLQSFRCYARAEAALAPGVTAVIGPNGAGKTSLIEGVHVACQGYSPRTGSERQCIRDGDPFARVEVEGETRGAAHGFAAVLSRDAARRLTIDGRALRSRQALDEWWACLVFLPDRLAVVKRAPAVRRAYVDRAASRFDPLHAAAGTSYAAALQQRNALLRRIRAGVASPDSLDAWDRQLAEHGADLVRGRRALVERLGPLFEERLEQLGGGGAVLEYRPRVDGDAAALSEALADRRSRDIERALTGAGPHLDDVVLLEQARDLRSHGSQGEQRTAVLALLLAEAAALREARGEPPVLLLDDVLSELDRDRRVRLLAAVREHGQAVVTTTDDAQLPASPDAVLRITAGVIAGSSSSATLGV